MCTACQLVKAMKRRSIDVERVANASCCFFFGTQRPEFFALEGLGLENHGKAYGISAQKEIGFAQSLNKEVASTCSEGSTLQESSSPLQFARLLQCNKEL